MSDSGRKGEHFNNGRLAGVLEQQIHEIWVQVVRGNLSEEEKVKKRAEAEEIYCRFGSLCMPYELIYKDTEKTIKEICEINGEKYVDPEFFVW